MAAQPRVPSTSCEPTGIAAATPSIRLSESRSDEVHRVIEHEHEGFGLPRRAHPPMPGSTTENQSASSWTTGSWAVPPVGPDVSSTAIRSATSRESDSSRHGEPHDASAGVGQPLPEQGRLPEPARGDERDHLGVGRRVQAGQQAFPRGPWRPVTPAASAPPRPPARCASPADHRSRLRRLADWWLTYPLGYAGWLVDVLSLLEALDVQSRQLSQLRQGHLERLRYAR